MLAPTPFPCSIVKVHPPFAVVMAMADCHIIPDMTRQWNKRGVTIALVFGLFCRRAMFIRLAPRTIEAAEVFVGFRALSPGPQSPRLISEAL